MRLPASRQIKYKGRIAQGKYLLDGWIEQSAWMQKPDDGLVQAGV
jgi:hypothetical protein